MKKVIIYFSVMAASCMLGSCSDLAFGDAFLEKAPGVDVTTAAVGGGYAQFTGTSFATPFVTGGAALMMEWGIVKGNDAYLYDAVIIGLS